MKLSLIEKLPITWNFNHRLDGLKECHVKYKEFSSLSTISITPSLFTFKTNKQLVEDEVTIGIQRLFKLIHKESISGMRKFSRVPKKIEEYNWYFKDFGDNVKVVRGELKSFIDRSKEGMTLARQVIPSIFITHIQINEYQELLSDLLFVEKLN